MNGSNVLADEDEEDSEDSSNEEDSSKEEDKTNEVKKEDSKDTEDSEDSKETNRVTTGSKVKIEDKEDTEDDEDTIVRGNIHATSPDQEMDDSEETAEVTSVTNPDGTVTKTYKKLDGNEVETKIVTYDANGKVISTQELNEDGSKDTEKTVLISTVTNPDGTITKTFSKSEDGHVEMRSLTYDANGVLIKKAELNPDGTIKEEELIHEDEEDSEESTDTDDETDDNEFEVTFVPSTDGTVDPALANIIKAKLEQEIYTNTALGTTVNKVELSIKTAQGTVKYEGTALKDEKLFGIFGIEIPVDIEVDPITGKILSVNQSFWSKILQFFSL